MKKNFLLLFFFLYSIAVFAQPSPIWVPYRDGNLWGYSDTLGKIKVRPVYDSAYTYDRGFAFVFKGKNVGLLNRTGTELIQPGYDVIEFHAGGYKVSKGAKLGFISGAGKLIFPVEYDELFEMEEGYLSLKKEKMYGLATPEGKMILPVQYDEITNYFLAKGVDSDNNFLLRKGNDKFLYNKKTNKIAAFNGSIAEMQEGIKDDSGTEETNIPQLEAMKKAVQGKLKADKVSSFQPQGVYSEQNFFLVDIKGKQSLVEYLSTGEIKTIIPAQYDAISYAISSTYMTFMGTKSVFLAAVAKDGKYGVVDEKGKVFIPFEYTFIGPLEGSWVVFQLVKAGKKGAYLPTTSYPIIKPLYEEIEYSESIPVNDNWSFVLFLVKKDGKPGYVGENGVEYFR